MFLMQSAALLAAVTLISFIPLRHAIDLIYGKNYFTSHMWTKGVCLLVAGVLIWMMGRYLNRAARENKCAPVRTFLFVKMEYWGAAFAAAAVLLILLG